MSEEEYEDQPPETGIPYGTLNEKNEEIAKLIHRIQPYLRDNQGRLVQGEVDEETYNAYNLEPISSLGNITRNEETAIYHLNEIQFLLDLKRKAKYKRGIEGIQSAIRGRKINDMKQSLSRDARGLRELSTAYNVQESHFIEGEKKESIFDKIRGGIKK